MTERGKLPMKAGSDLGQGCCAASHRQPGLAGYGVAIVRQKLCNIPSLTSSGSIFRLLLSFVITVFPCWLASADDVIPPESERWKVVHRVLNRSKVSLRPIFRWTTAEFCGQMLKDLKAGRNIEVIEPVVKTNDANDPSLDRYRACRQHWDGAPSPDGGLNSLDTLGQRAFRLYRIDLDHNPQNGLEEVIAADLVDETGMARRADYTIGFHVIDLKECGSQWGQAWYIA